MISSPAFAAFSRPPTRAELVTRQLRDELLSGRVAPDEALRQDEIAQRFDMSHSPVREALRRLDGEGLVTHVPNLGLRARRYGREDLDELVRLLDLLEHEALRAMPAIHASEVPLEQAWDAGEDPLYRAVFLQGRQDHLARLLRMYRNQFVQLAGQAGRAPVGDEALRRGILEAAAAADVALVRTRRDAWFRAQAEGLHLAPRERPAAPRSAAGPSTAHSVASLLRHRIGSGSLKPGSSITISSIAQESNVSVQPVREALAVLAAEGRVSRVAHATVTVADLSTEDLTGIYRLRDLVETEAIRTSGPLLQADDVARLMAEAEAYRAAVNAGDPETMRSTNRNFFAILRSRAPSERVAEVTTHLRALSAPYRSRSFVASGDATELAELHDEIVTALRAGDMQVVVTAAEDLRRTTLERLQAVPSATED